jgi:hypothetical protein
MAKRKKTKRHVAEGVTATTVIVLGLGALAAGVAIYEWTKPKAVVATNPAALTPSGSGVSTVLAPS